MKAVLFTSIVLLLCVGRLRAQDDVGPEIPIVLEHADSLIGSGDVDAAVRTFQGNVRFSQGNVTGRCDRAVHDVIKNTVELTGSVVIRQVDLTITAPVVRYDGRSSVAQAPRGIRVDQGRRVITSRSGRYDLRRRISTFQQNVHAVDDTVRIWCDSLIHDRTIDTMRAMGNVLIQDSVRRSWFSADLARRQPGRGELSLYGSSKAWSWDADSAGISDTVFISSDQMLSESQPEAGRRMTAQGNVRLVRGQAAAVCGRLVYSDQDSIIDLSDAPVVWSDSSVLIASAIKARADEGRLRTITGDGEAILLSRSDTLMPERFDQIVGKRITITSQDDSVKLLTAAGDAQSVTYRQESGQRKGLAKVASDSIDARIVPSGITDVLWIGGVSGEHHPERLVAGRESDFNLPGFRAPGGRPVSEPVPRRSSLLR